MTKAPSPPPPPSPVSPVEDIPEFMKANRRIAGRVCSHCNMALELGDDAFNCCACGASMHAACRNAAGGCTNAICPNSVLTNRMELAPEAASAVPAAAVAPDEVPCRFCGERIKRDARKCRFCNEFQYESDRSAIAAKKTAGDDKLTGWEIALGILCGGIACIVAIVYLVQGKKKGWKLLLIAIIANIVGAIIQMIIAGAQRP